jgi:hypothetical protein
MQRTQIGWIPACAGMTARQQEGSSMHGISVKLQIVAGAMLVLSALQAYGQSFPSKPIRIVVPLAAGGPGDVLARSVAQKLTETMGQQVVVDNRPGANTNIGNEAVAKSAPDGYTLLATASTLTINPALYANLTYDAVKSFAPVTLIAWTPLVLVVHPSLPVKSVPELAALAKAKPGQIYYGSAGSGSVLHLAGEMFNTMASVKLVHVPYKGVTNAFSDLLGGQISLMFPGAPIALRSLGVVRHARPRRHAAGDDRPAAHRDRQGRAIARDRRTLGCSRRGAAHQHARTIRGVPQERFVEMGESRARFRRQGGLGT